MLVENQKYNTLAKWNSITSAKNKKQQNQLIGYLNFKHIEMLAKI